MIIKFVKNIFDFIFIVLSYYILVNFYSLLFVLGMMCEYIE